MTPHNRHNTQLSLLMKSKDEAVIRNALPTNGPGAKNTPFNSRFSSAEKHVCRSGSLLASFRGSPSFIPEETSDLLSGKSRRLSLMNRLCECVGGRNPVHQQHQVCEGPASCQQAFVGLVSTNASAEKKIRGSAANPGKRVARDEEEIGELSMKWFDSWEGGFLQVVPVRVLESMCPFGLTF